MSDNANSNMLKMLRLQ